MRRSLALLLIMLMSNAARADEPNKLVGAWEGTLTTLTNKKVRLVFKIAQPKDEKATVVFDSPDEELYDLALDPVEVGEKHFKVGIKLSRATFEGTLSEDGSAIDGTFTQGVSRMVTLKKVDPSTLPKPPSFDLPAELVGLWEGKLSVQGGIELRLVLNISKRADGSIKAALDSPDQNANGLPISSISFSDGTLKFESKLLKASFEGKHSADKTSFEGSFTQGRKYPLVLKKTEEVSQLNRPQQPKPPFPYREEKVAYENKDGGVKLGGTLTLPPGDGPFPAVILITGSGAQDRDETLLGHKPFLVLADYLTRRGVAVLRVDDRGVGESTGNISTSTSADFAGDVLAGVAFLKSHAKIDGKKIGLCGHSEGGLIAPIVASRSDDVAFIVLMAGTGVPGTEILKEQGYLIAKAMGASEAALKVSGQISEKMYQVLSEEKDNAKAVKILKEMTKAAVANLSESDRKAIEEETEEETVGAALEQVTTPWFRYFLTYDPRPTLAKVKCPVLALNGAKDLQVPPRQNLPEIEKAIKSGGNDKVTLVELEGLNHLFQHCKTGAPAEYAQIEETLAPEALRVIGDWVVEQTKSK